MKIQFTKMHGLGNDFVVIDATQHPVTLSKAQIQQISNRRLGIGFDQLLLLESPKNSDVDFHYRIFNADGTEVGQCGNGARCIAQFIRENGLSHQSEIKVSTIAETLKLILQDDGKVIVNMGTPHFEPEKIPFIANDIAHYYDVQVAGTTVKLSVVNVGNPHAVIQVSQIHVEEVLRLGEALSTHERFPEGVNVEFMQIIDPHNIRLRVYERGVGETLACGSGACAAMVIGRRNGLLQERVTVNQPGGSLTIDWQGGPGMPITMIGPAKTVYRGEFLY